MIRYLAFLLSFFSFLGPLFSQANDWPPATTGTGRVSIGARVPAISGLIAPQDLLHIRGYINGIPEDPTNYKYPALRISMQVNTSNNLTQLDPFAQLAVEPMTTAATPIFSSISKNKGDVVLRSAYWNTNNAYGNTGGWSNRNPTNSLSPQDLILSAQAKGGGNIRFATLPINSPSAYRDVERMTITEKGTVGVNADQPQSTLHLHFSPDRNWSSGGTPKPLLWYRSPELRMSLFDFPNEEMPNHYSNFASLGVETQSSGSSKLSNLSVPNDFVVRTSPTVGDVTSVFDGVTKNDNFILTSQRTGGAILFGTTPSNLGGATLQDVERMRITSEGNVGIGTTTPHSENGLHIHANKVTSPTVIEPTTASIRLSYDDRSVATPTDNTYNSLRVGIAPFATAWSGLAAKYDAVYAVNCGDMIFANVSNSADTHTESNKRSGAIRFTTYNGSESEKMIITNDGSVGIGAHDPHEILQLGSRMAFHVGAWPRSIGDNWQQLAANGYGRIENGAASRMFMTNAGSIGWNTVPSDLATVDISQPSDGELPTSLNTVIYTSDGKFGIGTTTPAQTLDVVGAIKFSNALMPGGNAGTTGQVLVSNGTGATPTWASSASFGWGLTGNAGTTDANFLGTTDNRPILFGTNSTSASTAEKMRLTTAGVLLINTKNPQPIAPATTLPTLSTGIDYKLFVNGAILTKELIVNSTEWADYVFASNYRLRTLEEVDKYIKANGHLEGIPTSAQVQKEGVAIGRLQIKLLEKLEELTLYIVEQDKKIQSLNEELANIQKTNR